MQPLIIIEGNISAGKSTLTRELAEALNYRVFLEPTSTNPFLADFYRDPKKYALRMQVCAKRCSSLSRSSSSSFFFARKL
jgi:deoxyadenosine/deoxycytidine kinase